MTDELIYDTPPTETAPPVVPEVPPEPETTPEDPAEPEAAETETDDEAEKPHKKTGSQRWKEKAAREAQEKEYWKAQALQTKPEAPVAPISLDGPKQDDYETHAEWVKASIRHEAKAMIDAEKRQQTWEQKASKAREKFEDFDDALQTAAAPSRAVAEVLNESPIGGDVAYHLATHPTEYERINRLGPVAAALELGRIEARLATPETKKTVPVTKAPKPPSPVTAASSAKPSDDGRIESY